MVSRSFAHLIGQPQAVALLNSAIDRHRIAPAYLFVGAPGVGRGLAAVGFLEQLLAPAEISPAALEQLQQRIQQRNHPDLLWVEPTYTHQGQLLSAAQAAEMGLQRRSAPLIRIEQIREVTRFLSRPPLGADRSIVVVEQVETMTEAAANSLLKTLEEPGQATLILIAPSVESLLPTLVSRCQKIPFYRLGSEAIAQILTQVGHADIVQHPEILALAQGSPGEAIAHWQMFQEIPADLLAAVRHPPASLRQALELARQIAQTLPSEAQIWLVDYLQHCYWQQQQTSALKSLEQARQHLLKYVQPRLVWEVTLMGMVE